jgi:type IV secretory pathway VirB10-like protein
MSTSPKVVRSALVIGAVAVSIALWMRSKGDDEAVIEDEEEGTSAQVEPAEPLPERAPAPARDEAARAPEPAAQPTAQGVAPEQEADAGPPPPLEPQLREHAVLMMTPLAAQAMEQASLEQLRSLRDTVRERKSEQLMKPIDVEGLDIAIGCAEGGPEAREEASDFLEFGQRTSFHDSLRKLCFGDRPSQP